MTTNPKVIAELSGNHNGSKDRALEIIKAVGESGVKYVKFQTYTPDTMTLNVENKFFQVSEDHKLWGGRKLYDLYKEAHTPWEWHEELFNFARKCGLVAFSTPFDESAVDFLEQLNCPIYKIASLEIVDLPLIAKVAETQKPLIISTGTATLEEIEVAVSTARNQGAKDLTLLVCTSAYPAAANEINLSRMNFLQRKFGVKVGFSDHTLGTTAGIAAATLGANMIEKHVTLSRSDGGVDSAFSMEVAELASFIANINDAAQMAGSDNVWRTESEHESIRLRPSLYFSEDVFPGDVVTNENVRSVRPSGGLLPVDINKILGKKIMKPAKLGDPTSWDYFDL